jgi:hypothetical protein
MKSRRLVVDVTHSCLRNVVTLFHYIEKEREWRKANGRPAGFETLDARKPIGKVEEMRFALCID